MARRPEKYLWDILDCCRFLIELTRHEDRARYDSDRMFRGAVERELQIIGEAMMQLRALDPNIASQIAEHERIIGFRHVIVHGYDVLDEDVIWLILKEKLPLLREQVEGLLGPDPDLEEGTR